MTFPPRWIVASTALASAAWLLAAACSSPAGEQQAAVANAEPFPAIAPPLDDLGTTAYEAALRVTLPAVPPEEDPGLHNVYRLSSHIVSGSEPHGEEAFQRLQEMGIRTILSVDGKIPDEEMARKYGMHYVHVPIQYRGITDDEMMRIAKTFRETEGPFYVHCFHGKHRGPAAAEVGRLVLDGISREHALAEMRQWCGTAPSYEGLYHVIADADVPTPEETAAYPFDFPAAHSFEGFRQAMIEVCRADDNLKYLKKRGWQPDADHPDVDALNEATKLASVFERSTATEEAAAKPADFRRWLEESVVASAALRDSIQAWRSRQGPVEELDRAYDELANLCSACHKDYRN